VPQKLLTSGKLPTITKAFHASKPPACKCGKVCCLVLDIWKEAVSECSVATWTSGLLADNDCTLCNLPSVLNEPVG